MTTAALVDNPAAIDPYKALTAAQQNALRCIDHYKHQKKAGNSWWFGNFKFSDTLVNKLVHHRLVVERRHKHGPYLALTEAGILAAERLRRKAK